jgi:hypothetical protein
MEISGFSTLCRSGDDSIVPSPGYPNHGGRESKSLFSHLFDKNVDHQSKCLAGEKKEQKRQRHTGKRFKRVASVSPYLFLVLFLLLSRASEYFFFLNQSSRVLWSSD